MARTIADQFERTLAASGASRIHVRQEEVGAFATGTQAHLVGEHVVCAVLNGRADEMLELGHNNLWL